jgi:transcriptional regulator
MPELFAPEPFPAPDPFAIVREYPFALLVTTSADGIHATSTPLVPETDDSREVLLGHLARRNKNALSIQEGQPALAVFSGPNAYVSPRWCKDKPEVPTWNYLVAHVRGTLTVFDDEASLRGILARTAEVMERDSNEPWTLEQAPEARLTALLPMIRGVRLKIESVEGATRLSQKHSPADRMRVAWNMFASGDGDSAQIARLIANLEVS